jgi:transposase-like protein
MCSPQVVYFMTHYSRGTGAADELLGKFNGILVTDQHGGYNHHPNERRQLCWAHIIRKFKKMASRYGQAGILGKRLLRLARLIVHLHNRRLAGAYADKLYRHRLDKLREAFRQTLVAGSRLRQAQHPDKPTKTANQCQRLLEDDQMLWTFLRYPDVPLTNNAAERAIRPYVIWRKTSFFSQSFRGDQFRPLILTVVETCKRLGANAYRIIRQASQQALAKKPVTVRLPIPHFE